MSLRSLRTMSHDSPGQGHGFSWTVWSALQRVGAGILLLLAMPVLAACYVLVKLTSPGPFLFRQRRFGYRGQPFEILKVRTMTVGSDRNAAFGLAVDNASRAVTRVGRILRELKIDELPQLWNVVRGDMSLVGPRAIATNLDEMLRSAIPGFERRYAVKPGLTNLAQISILDNARGDGLVDDWSARFEAELQYARVRSPAVDLLILSMTAAFVLRKMLMSIRPARSA